MKARVTFLAAGLAFAPLLLAAGQVPTRLFVSTLPPGAQVFLDGKSIGKSDGLFVVEPGPHMVRMQLDGYRPDERRVDLPAEKITRVVVQLSKAEPGTAPPPREDARTARFRIRMVHEMTVTATDGQTCKTESEHKLDFTQEHRGLEMLVRCDGAAFVLKEHGKEISRTTANREKISLWSLGSAELVFTPKDRDPQIQQLFRMCFDAPLLTIVLDPSGKEIMRKVSISDDIRQFPLGGAPLDYMLLFHAPVVNGQQEWSWPSELDMGGELGKVRGDLKFTRLGDAGGNAEKVGVSGTLTLDHAEVPKFGIVVNEVRYQITGQLTSDSNRRAWTAGSLVVGMTWKSLVGGQAKTHQGTSKVTLERLLAPAGPKDAL